MDDYHTLSSTLSMAVVCWIFAGGGGGCSWVFLLLLFFYPAREKRFGLDLSFSVCLLVY